MHSIINNMSKLASSILWTTFILMLIPTTYIMMNKSIILMEWTLYQSMNTPIMMTLIMDPIGMPFACVVLLISANVLSFSSIYMKEDKFINRFTVIVILFILSMNLLIFIPHMMILLLGWDGLGLVSFILVIYYQNNKSLGAGLITAYSNRIGDALLLIAIAITLNQGHWMIMNMITDKMINMQMLLIMGAAMTKSAQMPFSSWLPAAMAAPTPVSALVHSSTLVTAGVFMLIRFYPFLSNSPLFSKSLLVIAVSTMLMAGMSATTECDMKKVIALSTLSQLGMMMTSLGFNLPSLTFFHMCTHAMFKALLFIGAGTFINFHSHSQDLRWMGQTPTQMPITTSCITVSNMALCGVPFMAGFYSKDMIIEMAMFSPFNYTMMMLTVFSVGLTAAYSIRFIFHTCMSPMMSSPWIQLKELSSINNPMLILSIAATTSGAGMMWIDPISSHVSFISSDMKMLPTVMMTMGILTGLKLSNMTSMMSINSKMSHYASCFMWFLVPLSSQFIMKIPLQYAHLNLKNLDQGWFEIPQILNNSIYMMDNKMINFYPKYSSHIMMSTMMLTLMILLIKTL